MKNRPRSCTRHGIVPGGMKNRPRSCTRDGIVPELKKKNMSYYETTFK